MGIFIAKSMQDAENYLVRDDEFNPSKEINKDPECLEIFKGIKMIERTTSGYGDLETDHYMMWKNDMRGKLWDHILVIGKIEHYGN